MSPSKSIKFGIIGGSIAGCAVAVELQRLGHDVKVFERSKIALEERGSGICLPSSLVQECIDRDLFDKTIPRHPLKSRSFPKIIADLICQTKQPFLQVVYDLYVPRLHTGRLLLMGDSNAVLRPHIGSGATKAIEEAISLAKHLKTTRLITDAMADWNEEGVNICNQLFNLATTMGDAMILHPPKWNEMDQEKMEAWWANIMAGKTWYATDEK